MRFGCVVAAAAAVWWSFGVTDLMQASEGEAESDSMFVNNNRPATRTSFPTAGGRGGGGGRSKGLMLVVLLVIAGIFGGFKRGRIRSSFRSLSRLQRVRTEKLKLLATYPLHRRTAPVVYVHRDVALLACIRTSTLGGFVH